MLTVCWQPQTQELVNYLARGLVDEARTAFIKPFQEVLITRDGQKPLAEDADRRRKTITMVLAEVKSLGLGNERGAYTLSFRGGYDIYNIGQS